MRVVVPQLALHPGQQAIEASAARFKVVCCGRRFGKTLSSLEWLILGHGASAVEGFPVAFFAPTYQLQLEVWKDAERTLAPVTLKANKTENRIELVTGGVVDFWTLQDDGAGRGRAYARVVIDEAAHARYLKDAWEQAILPTLTDLQGHARIISTPAGRNYFWELYERGSHAPGWASFTFPTSANPHIAPAEIERMRAILPERIFAQEYLAQFLEDGGGVFRRVTAAVDPTLADGLHRSCDAGDGRAYVIGIDWGRHEDFTVYTVLDARDRAVVALERFTRIEYAFQLARLQALRARFPRAAVVAESNSIGGPLIEQLRRDGVNVTAFQTTHASKAQIIEALALAFEDGALRIPPEQWLIDELMAFDQERTASGMMRYGAPRGGHDDGVMSLAIAWHAQAASPGRVGSAGARVAVPGFA